MAIVVATGVAVKGIRKRTDMLPYVVTPVVAIEDNAQYDQRNQLV